MNAEQGTGRPDLTLTEFEAWCRGEGRVEGAGVHYRALEHAARFRQFKKRQEALALEALQERSNV